MAASTSACCALPSSSTLADGIRSPRQIPAPRCAVLLSARARLGSKSIGCYPRITRSVVSMATGESFAPGESSEEAVTEVPELVKTAQEAWDKLDDKYAVVALGFAGIVALWGSTGVISAIDRLPLVPGVLELVGIGYTAWFAYQNLVFKPDREALIDKVKGTYNDIIGSS